MQIIALEKAEFDKLQRQIAELHEAIHNKNPRQQVYDNQDVMQMLNVSQRTLATWRENGTLRYSKVGAKIYYKPEHIDEMLNNGMVDHLNLQS